MIDPEIPRHRKRAARHKPWATQVYMEKLLSGSRWESPTRYATERAAREALATFARGGGMFGGHPDLWPRMRLLHEGVVVEEVARG